MPRRKIRAAIDALRDAPDLGKELSRDLEGFRSLRVGDYRVIYRLTRDRILVAAVGPRKTIYSAIDHIREADVEARSAGQ